MTIPGYAKRNQTNTCQKHPHPDLGVFQCCDILHVICCHHQQARSLAMDWFWFVFTGRSRVAGIQIFLSTHGHCKEIF